MRKRGFKPGRPAKASSLLLWWRSGRRSLRLEIKRQLHHGEVVAFCPLDRLGNPIGLRAFSGAAQFAQALGVLGLEANGDRYAGHRPTLPA